MANKALQTNPTTSDLDITTHASDWLWAVFSVMLLSDLIMIWWAYARPRGSRVFHQLPILILTTASIAYFSMASDLGATPIVIEFTRGRAPGTTRSIWWVRYIDWTITTPLLLLELLLATGMALSDIVTVIFMDIVMIVTGLAGALVQSSYKWGFFTMGCAALVYIWGGLLWQAPRSAELIGQDVRSAYVRGALYLSFIWLLYPVAWGLADGGNVISPTGEMVFYGVLDLLAKPVFCFMHIYALRNVSYERFAMSSGKVTAADLTGGRGGKNIGPNGAADFGSHGVAATSNGGASVPTMPTVA